MAKAVFRENVVVITGASSGIGRELAYQLAEQGAWLALAARSVDRLEAVAAECESRGGRALVVPTDVGEEDQCKRLIEQTVEAFGRVDTLINNAGYSMRAWFGDIADMAVMERIMQVDYFGSVYCTHYALPHLRQSRGRVVGVSSLNGKTGVPKSTGYAAAKHAMAGFFDSLRIEMKEHGVSVTMIYPGYVDTAVRRWSVGPDGKPGGRTFPENARLMSVETCGRVIMRAMARRSRQVIMPPKSKVMLPVGKVLQLAQAVAPELIDGIAERTIRQGY
jgi:short-subunit dehydrogenase